MLAPLLTALSLLAGPPAPPPADEAFVTADVLRVRAGPATNAATVGRLAITARVQVLERKEDWARVAGEGLQGWVAAVHLGPKRLDASDVEKALKTAKGQERLDWLERQVALAPWEMKGWRALVDVYRGAKLKEKERLARDVIAGRATTYVAGCGRVLLGVRSDGSLAEVEAEGALPSAGGAATESPERAALGRLSLALAEASWWPLGGAPVSRPLASLPSLAVEEACEATWSAQIVLPLPGGRCDTRLPAADGLVTSWFTGTYEPAGSLDGAEPQPPPDDDQIRHALNMSSLYPGEYGPLEPLGDGPLWVLPYSCSNANEAADGPTYDGWAVIRSDELDQNLRLEIATDPSERAETGKPVWFWFGRAHVGLRAWRFEKTISTPDEREMKVRASGFWYFVDGPAGTKSGTIVVAREGGQEC